MAKATKASAIARYERDVGNPGPRAACDSGDGYHGDG